MDNYQIFQQFTEPIIFPNKIQLEDNHETALKFISGKKQKMLEYRNLQKIKNDLYWKLSQKLSQQLKQKKNHNTLQARQKLYLLQKCRNQKHIRRKTTIFIKQTQNNPFEHPKSSIYSRPTTGCSKSRILKNPSKSINIQKTKSNRKSQMKQKQNINLQDIRNKFETIKYKCMEQRKKSLQIKQDIDTALFYQKLVGKNSSVIFNRIL